MLYLFFEDFFNLQLRLARPEATGVLFLTAVNKSLDIWSTILPTSFDRLAVTVFALGDNVILDIITIISLLTNCRFS